MKTKKIIAFLSAVAMLSCNFSAVSLSADETTEAVSTATETVTPSSEEKTIIIGDVKYPVVCDEYGSYIVVDDEDYYLPDNFDNFISAITENNLTFEGRMITIDGYKWLFVNTVIGLAGNVYDEEIIFEKEFDDDSEYEEAYFKFIEKAEIPEEDTPAVEDEPEVENPLVKAYLTDAVVKPGGITFIDLYLDSNIDICSFEAGFSYNKDVFKITALSLNDEIDCSDRSLKYSQDNSKFIFLNETKSGKFENRKFENLSPVRIAVEVSKDAPEGDYSLVLGDFTWDEDKKDFIISESSSSAAVRMNPKTSHCDSINMSFSSGTVTVSNSDTPKTQVKPRPLTRTYCAVSGVDSRILGDTTNDGKVNVSDITKLKSYMLGACDEANYGDINENGSIDISDVILLKSYILEN